MPAAFAGVKTVVAIDHGADGPSATIPDSHLLFTADFSRAGQDLILRGEHGKTFLVQDYFASDERARLLSADGAALTADVVAALAGPLAPGQYAQAGAPQARVQTVGRIAVVEGDATIVRNGVAVAAKVGDVVHKGDVLQTVTGALGVTFNDGSTLNLTANSRLVVNEFIYDPNGSANSQLLNLVQGSLTFISGEVAHTGDMKIGTPVATMGIRGTVGGVTNSADGTAQFYVSQSATGAVIIDSNGRVVANVVQDGPLIIVRPIGPLQILAEEVQKTPEQLATELAALQHIVNVQSVGQQIIQQFFQQDPNNPNPQSNDGVHTQIQVAINTNPGGNNSGNTGGDGTTPPPGTATVTVITTPETPSTTTTPIEPPPPIIIPIPPNLAPVNFGPLQAATNEDQTLTFSGATAISVFDADTTILRVTLTATHGILTLSGTAGLAFSNGGNGAAAMTFSGTQAAINAALNGLTFTPDPDYNGPASVQIVSGDGNSTTAPQTIAITVNAVNDAPVVTIDQSAEHSTIAENATLAFAANAIHVSDVDNAELTVTLAVAVGSLSLGSLAGLSFTQGDGADDASMTFHGTQAAINAALDGLIFTPAHGFTGETSLSIAANDGHLTTTSQVEIAVAPQAPTLIVVRDTLVVNPGSTVLLGIAVLGHDFSDNLSVKISGLSSDDSLTNLWHDHFTIVDGSVTLTPLQLFGLSFTPGSGNVDHLSVTAFNTQNGVTSSTAPQSLSIFVDAPPHAASDSIITNVATGTTFEVPDWVLLQNDSDPDNAHDQLTITNVNHALSLDASHQGNQVAVTDKTTFLDLFGKGGSFDYTVSDGLATDSGHVTVSLDTNGSLDGTNGNDILVGKASGSTIKGNGGNDILIGGNGNDIMTGGSGADTFVFKNGNGADVITDFSGHNGAHDVIALDNFPFATFAELQLANVIFDIDNGVDHSTLIDFGGGNSVTLDHVNFADLNESDFIFHPHTALIA